MASRIQIRRDTAQNWFDVNPELLPGEICYETDTGKLKIGTGAHWNSTDYFIYEDSKLADLFDVTITGAAAGDFLRYNSSSSVWYNDAVDLGTDTIGDYVASLTQGTGLTITDNSGEGSTPTIGVTPYTYDSYGSASAAYNEANSYTNGVVDALSSDDIEEGSFSLYFTDQRALNATALTYDLVGSAASAEFNAVGQAQEYTDGRFTALTTLYVPEEENLYFTQQRAIDSGSATYEHIGEAQTLIDGLTTSDIEEGGNRYFTNQRAIDAASATYDAIGAASSAYTDATDYADGLASNYDSAGSASTAYTNAVAYADGLTTTDIAEGTSLYFTDERAQDAVGNAVGTGLTYTDGTGAIAVNTSVIQERVANVTDTEIGYLDGVTSAIQTQIDTKAPSASPTFTGVVTLPDNTVALGTKTTGDYVASLVAGTGVTLTNNSGETATPTVAIGQAVGTSASVTFSNITATGIVTLSEDPTSALQAATKQYVDNVTAGINFHESVHAASVSNLSTIYNNGTAGVGATLTADTNRAFSTLDGESVTVGQRILIKAQTDAKQNGIYTLTTVGSGSAPWVITRATDADNSPVGELKTGDFCFVMSGATNAGYGYINSSATNPIVIGTDNITYTPFNAAQTITNGSGINFVSNVLSVDTTTIQARVTDVSDTEIGYLNGVTSAIQTQIDTKAPIASPTFTGTVSGITATMVGLGSVDNTADTAKPVSTAQQTALDLKANLNSPTFTGTVTLPNNTVALGTQTTGNYMSNITAGTGLTVSHTAGEGSSASVSLNATLDNLSDVSASAPTDGNFLKYVSASSAWVPASIPTINYLDDIGDVSASAPSSGQFLKWNGTAWIADSIPTINALDDIGNVTAPTPSDGQFLKYVSASSAWVPSSIPTINALDDIGDVTAPSPSSGDFLKWSGTAWVNASGVVTTSDTGSVTSTMISNGTIVDADINSAAAIALSKLASGTSGQVIVANSGGVPTYVTPSGDVTWTNAGVTSIKSNVALSGAPTAATATAGTNTTQIATTAFTTTAVRDSLVRLYMEVM